MGVWTPQRVSALGWIVRVTGLSTLARGPRCIMDSRTLYQVYGIAGTAGTAGTPGVRYSRCMVQQVQEVHLVYGTGGRPGASLAGRAGPVCGVPGAPPQTPQTSCDTQPRSATSAARPWAVGQEIWWVCMPAWDGAGRHYPL